jgi:hypothetical protein
MSAYAGTTPDDYTTNGAGTFSKETTITRFGGASCKQVNGIGQLRSPTIKVYDDAGYTWRFWAWVYSTVAPGGNVTVDLVRADTHVAIASVAISDTINAWQLVEIESADVGSAGGGCKMVTRHVAPGYTVYTDAYGCQPVTWTRRDVYGPLGVGLNACDLWHAGNDYLELNAATASYECSVLDLATIANTAFPEAELTIGQTLVVRDDVLSDTQSMRVLEYTRYYTEPRATDVRLGTPRTSISELIQTRQRIIGQPSRDETRAIGLVVAKDLVTAAAAITAGTLTEQPEEGAPTTTAETIQFIGGALLAQLSS